MHEGCSAAFTSGKQIVDKLRMMGFSGHTMPGRLRVRCTGCGEEFVMESFEAACGCGMVHGVTPCHADSASNVLPAGIDY